MRASVVLSLLAIVIGASTALALPNDLQCFKVTNQNLKSLKAVVDLDAPVTGAAAGCKLTKAKFYCVPTETTVRAGTLLDGKRPVTPVPFVGLPTDVAQLCYGVKCKKPAGVAPDRTVTDAFGVHQLSKLQTSMLCKPVVPTTLQLRSPDVVIDPGQEIVYCAYFRADINDARAVKRWTSRLPAHAAKVIVVLTRNDRGLPGTQSAVNCQVFPLESTNELPTWAYTADEPEASYDFPADDGTGKPVGLFMKPGQTGYLYIHYINKTALPVTGHVEVDATFHDPTTEVTRADSLVTYNASISIPPGSAKSHTFTCTPPAGVKFLSLSTHSHKQSVHTYVRDGVGNPILFESTDFRHPGTVLFAQPPFLSLSQLTYQCDYVNPTGRTIGSGSSPATDELCMAITYFFPGTGARICVNNGLF